MLAKSDFVKVDVFSLIISLITLTDGINATMLESAKAMNPIFLAVIPRYVTLSVNHLAPGPEIKYQVLNA